MAGSGIRIGVDTGGTFTDLVLDCGNDTPWVTHKLPSTPRDPAQAALQGIAEILAKAGAVDATPEVIHGSTVATNALLEGKGANTAFVTTAGFEDTLHIGRQDRPDLYALEPKRNAPPVRRENCIGVEERLDYLGEVVTPLAQSHAAKLVATLKSRGIESVAISLLHSYANPAHEQQLAATITKALPGVHLTLSSDLLPEFREYERGSTCIANAAVAPKMAGYIGRLVNKLGSLNLRVMASAGGSLPPVSVVSQPVHTVLSGPAGGVGGALALAKLAGYSRIITLDMGGTSTDVSLCDQVVSQSTQGQLSGMPIRVPMIDIETVGAGGGSIAWIDDGGALRLGPQSAGANPGPACYGNQTGVPLATVTDANVVLGRLPDSQQLGGTLSINAHLANVAVAKLAGMAKLTLMQAAEGILRIAETTMARAIRRVSVERGYDPREFTMVSFGGAGGLHAAKLAEQLGMKRVLIPPNPGLLSAVGMVNATAQYDFSQAVMHSIDSQHTGSTNLADIEKVASAIEHLTSKAGTALDAENVAGNQRVLELSLDLRFVGQSHELTIPLSTDPLQTFKDRHEALYGYLPEQRGIEIIAARIRATQLAKPLSLLPIGKRCESESPLAAKIIQLSGGAETAGKLYLRSELLEGDSIVGPAVISEYSATTYLPQNWSLTVDAQGFMLLTMQPAKPSPAQRETRQAAPVELEIFNNLFAAIAEEMGVRLMRSAYSPNIKERRDFSCALFNAKGQMMAQAAHIPVHLGAMPLSVQAVLAKFKPATMQPDDVYVVNDPFSGGTHLPDITVVAPVFVGRSKAPAFYVANRAHHADVGGLSPGSMGLATSIEDEGIRIAPSLLDANLKHKICQASRTPDERSGDLLAQLAALGAGVEALHSLCKVHTAAHVKQMGHELIAYSASMMESIISRIPDGTYFCSDLLDDDGHGTLDIRIHCKLTVHGPQASLDFSRSDAEVAGPMNAVRAITESAVAYCFRCLAPSGFPSNSGMTLPLEIVTVPGTIVDARYPAAVAAGNVETSQRITDVVFGALALALPDVIPACSQGTMNNVTLGGYDPLRQRSFAYYETIAGGCGAGPGGDGASGLHSHMTNTLNTPVEALEHEYPLRVTNYSIREYGGAGLHNGGAGLLREYLALVPTEVTVLSERRRNKPTGAYLGSAGIVGHNICSSQTGELVQHGGKFSTTLQAGSKLQIATPGGGGWGRRSDISVDAPAVVNARDEIKRDLRIQLGETIAASKQRGAGVTKRTFREILLQHYSTELAKPWGASARELMALYEPLIQSRPVYNPRIAKAYFKQPSSPKRKQSGSFYTPASLVQLVLDHALQPVLDQARTSAAPLAALTKLRIYDPACGSGRFLLAAFERLIYAYKLAGGEICNETLSQLARCIHGRDTNQLALDLCRACLAKEAGGSYTFELSCGDGLAADPAEMYDVIIGNPPFVNAINRGVKRSALDNYRRAFPVVTGSADLAAYFLAAAVTRVKPGGKIGFILPRSILNTPTLLDLRENLPTSLQPNLIFCPKSSSLFTSAAVFVCALVLGANEHCLLGAGQLNGQLNLRSAEVEPANWWAAIADLGNETQSHQPLSGAALGELFNVQASMTAAEAYNLVPLLADGGCRGLKLVTTGLIDPGKCMWGEVTCRYLKHDYAKPRIAGDASKYPSLLRRLKQAQRPKLIVAGLSSRIECMLDSQGECCGAVSTYSIFHPNDDLDALANLCSVLNGPHATAMFIRELGANALGGGNITMKKSFLQGYMLPDKSG